MIEKLIGTWPEISFSIKDCIKILRVLAINGREIWLWQGCGYEVWALTIIQLGNESEVHIFKICDHVEIDISTSACEIYFPA